MVTIYTSNDDKFILNNIDLQYLCNTLYICLYKKRKKEIFLIYNICWIILNILPVFLIS